MFHWKQAKFPIFIKIFTQIPAEKNDSDHQSDPDCSSPITHDQPFVFNRIDSIITKKESKNQQKILFYEINPKESLFRIYFDPTPMRLEVILHCHSITDIRHICKSLCKGAWPISTANNKRSTPFTTCKCLCCIICNYFCPTPSFMTKTTALLTEKEAASSCWNKILFISSLLKWYRD